MKKAFLFILFVLGIFSYSIPVSAQEIVPAKQTTVKAQVLDIVKQEVKAVPGTDVTANYQTISVKILEGNEKDTIVIVENDYVSLKKGEVFYLMHTTGDMDYPDTYAVMEPYRLPSVYFFVGLFILCVLIFGGIQGIRGLISLAGSFFLILYILLPAIIHGYSALILSIGVSSLIIILGSYITHGFNRTTTSAVIGMIITIVFTGALAYVAVHTTRLSGFSSEETVYLNLDTRGTIDFVGLLLGGIIIGLLGVLYDVAIGQAIAVEELHSVAPHLSRSTIYKRAIRMGREHIGALVNTLAIAYVGASLPLLLLFYSNNSGLGLTVNREIFSTEIIRTMIGSIGLVLAVPITTCISTVFLIKKTEGGDLKTIEQEKKALEHVGHHH
jgi:uncharacterized membrane protein